MALDLISEPARPGDADTLVIDVNDTTDFDV